MAFRGLNSPLLESGFHQNGLQGKRQTSWGSLLGRISWGRWAGSAKELGPPLFNHQGWPGHVLPKLSFASLLPFLKSAHWKLAESYQAKEGSEDPGVEWVGGLAMTS